ncbi:phosphodiesterase [Deinococcus hohokamensis]|uniref:Phosphodiesterase n=1 Tax=Deinococcus hohokamensis TaxID=309883 RepID=A0ABV9I5F5_9DEIO
MLIAQLSDLHLTADLSGEAAHALRRAVAHLLEPGRRPDAVLITGDCTEHGEAAEYAVLQHLLRPLSMPVYAVPGNHDQRPAMLAALGCPGTQRLDGFLQFAAEAGPLRLLGLDTHVPGDGGGELCARRLDWLEARLNEAPAQPTLIFLHHPPAMSGLEVMDRLGLAQAGALEALVARHPQVERVLAGHVHMALTRRFGGTLLMTAPAPGHTWGPDLSRPHQLSVALQPGACLLHHWSPHSGLVTLTSVITPDQDVLELHDGVSWRS